MGDGSAAAHAEASKVERRLLARLTGRARRGRFGVASVCRGLAGDRARGFALFGPRPRRAGFRIIQTQGERLSVEMAFPTRVVDAAAFHRPANLLVVVD